MSSAAKEAPAGGSTSRFQVKREAVLAAAAHHFNQQGVKGATLADIAASVGLVTTSVTYYYRKKEDLATACFLRAIAAHERRRFARALEKVTEFLSLVASTDYATLPSENFSGAHIMRASNIQFMYAQKVIPFEQ